MVKERLAQGRCGAQREARTSSKAMLARIVAFHCHVTRGHTRRIGVGNIITSGEGFIKIILHSGKRTRTPFHGLSPFAAAAATALAMARQRLIALTGKSEKVKKKVSVTSGTHRGPHNAARNCGRPLRWTSSHAVPGGALARQYNGPRKNNGRATKLARCNVVGARARQQDVILELVTTGSLGRGERWPSICSSTRSASAGVLSWCGGRVSFEAGP